MKTLFLGSYGFGNLGDELCLLEAIRRFPSSEQWAFSADPDYSRRVTPLRNFITDRAAVRELKFERIVLGGGGVGFWPSLRDSLHWMRDGLILERPAELHIHNIGVGKITHPDWHSDEIVRRVVAALASFTVRDHVSRWLALEWGFGVDPGITFYPEVHLAPDATAMPTLKSTKKLVGISITSQRQMMDAMRANRDLVRRYIESLGEFDVVPIVSTVLRDEEEENDINGFKEFAGLYLGNRTIVMPEMLDSQWRATQLTPLRLKHVISQLSFLISQRKHNIIHAIGTGVPFCAIYPDIDDSLLRILFSLRDQVPMGSTMLPLRTGRYSSQPKA